MYRKFANFLYISISRIYAGNVTCPVNFLHISCYRKCHIFPCVVCSELGLHRELANSVLSQFGVVCGPWRAMDSPNLASGFQSSSYSILYPYIKTTVHPHPPTLLLPPPSHPITTICDIITRSKKAAQNRLNFGYQKCIHPLSDS